MNETSSTVAATGSEWEIVAWNYKEHTRESFRLQLSTQNDVVDRRNLKNHVEKEIFPSSERVWMHKVDLFPRPESR